MATVLDKWLRARPTLGRLRMAAEALAEYGARSDLAVLTRYQIEGPSDAVQSAINDATFAVKRRSFV